MRYYKFKGWNREGYAVCSDDIKNATPRERVALNLIGGAVAGGPSSMTVTPGSAVRVQTGASIPAGADAVLCEEFAERREDALWACNTAERGRNILHRGADISKGELIASGGTRLSPGAIGLLAAGGYEGIDVYRQPRLAIVAIGDELVAPGGGLPDGKLYASNLKMLEAWCRR